MTALNSTKFISADFPVGPSTVSDSIDPILGIFGNWNEDISLESRIDEDLNQVKKNGIFDP